MNGQYDAPDDNQQRDMSVAKIYNLIEGDCCTQSTMELALIAAVLAPTLAAIGAVIYIVRYRRTRGIRRSKIVEMTDLPAQPSKLGPDDNRRMETAPVAEAEETDQTSAHTAKHTGTRFSVESQTAGATLTEEEYTQPITTFTDVRRPGDKRKFDETQHWRVGNGKVNGQVVCGG